MSLRITILGSGTIIPTPGRRPAAIVIEHDGHWSLFDCGPGSLEALAEAGYSFREVRRIYLTHFHPDHTLGLGHLLAALRVDGATRERAPLTIFGPPGLADLIERWHALYPSTVCADSSLELVALADGDVQSAAGVSVRAAGVDHDGAPALAYRIEARGKAVVYTGDCAYTEALADLAGGADIVIAECSFPDHAPRPGHMTPSAVARLASRSRAGRVVLVHLYPSLAGGDAVRAVRSLYDGQVAVASDGMRIDL